MNPGGDFRIMSQTTVGNYAFLSVDRCRLVTPDGPVVDRIVIRHPGAVAVVPVIGDDVVLIEQYRVAVDAYVVEIPAGKLDPGDVTVEAAAARELEEETGYSAGSFTHLTTILTAVGFSDERISILLAEGLEPGDAAPAGAEERSARVKRVPLAVAVASVVAGEITDSKTIAGIMIADAHRRAT